MEWLNIHSSTVDSEAMQDADPADRGTWLFLARYCAGQENGGRIAGAKGWNDRKWFRQVSLSQAEVEKKTGLWSWDGEDLVVEFYPADQERVYQAKRRGGRTGGKKSGAVRRSHSEALLEANLEGVLQGEVEANLEANLEGVLEGKGREGKERKGKVREEDHSPFAEIPSEQEVRTWAGMSGVDPEFASEKWAATGERHGWVANGRLIDWRKRYLRFWVEDREVWFQKRKKTAPENGQAAEGDQSWWWTEPREVVERALTGAILGQDEKTTARLREVLTQRGKTYAG